MNDWPEEYIVDVTKAPIGPPHLLKRTCGWLGSDLVETKESIAQTKKYHEYIEKYRKALNESRNKSS